MQARWVFEGRIGRAWERQAGGAVPFSPHALISLAGLLFVRLLLPWMMREGPGGGA